MFRALLALTLFHVGWSASATIITPQYDNNAKVCPAPDETNRYVEVPLLPKLEDIAVVQNIPGLKTHEKLREIYADLKLKIYFELAKPYDPKQEILMLINGGPGGNHGILHNMTKPLKESGILDRFNVVAMDHRGVGCSRPIFPGDMPIESFLMRYAASDIDAIRQALGGVNGKINVWGISYGTMLGQTYALLFPKNLHRLMLISAFSSYKDFVDADQNYKHTLLDWDPKLRTQFDELSRTAPEVARAFLFWSQGRMYNFPGRTVDVPKNLSEALGFVQQGQKDKALSLFPEFRFVMGPMTRAIMCQEILTPSSRDGQLHLFEFMRDACHEFAGSYDYFDYTGSLKNISARTFLWSGKYDHVTPRAAMDKMAAQIPNNFYLRDPHLGHSPEKRKCDDRLYNAFLSDAKDADLQAIADSPDCANTPAFGKPPVFTLFLNPPVLPKEGMYHSTFNKGVCPNTLKAAVTDGVLVSVEIEELAPCKDKYLLKCSGNICSGENADHVQYGVTILDPSHYLSYVNSDVASGLPFEHD